MLVVAHIFGFVAPALSLAGTVPTAGRPLRARSVDGLSFGALMLGMLCSQLWLAYGVLIADPAQVATNVVWAVIRVVLLVAFVATAAPGTRARCCGAAVSALAGGFVVITAGLAAVGTVAVVLSIVASLPQVALTLRRGAGPGLSLAAMRLAIASTSAWTIYGIARGDAAVLSCSLVGVVLNVVLYAAAVTAPGVLLGRATRRLVDVVYADALVVRRLTHLSPVFASNIEAHLPSFADGIRGRHHRLQQHRARLQPAS